MVKDCISQHLHTTGCDRDEVSVKRYRKIIESRAGANAVKCHVLSISPEASAQQCHARH